jgi:large subunit ribosomal protein L18
MGKAKGPLYQVHFRRRREGRTDYEKRLGLLKSGRVRMVVRKTNRYVIVQFNRFGEKGDETIAAATSRELGKQGFQGKCNTPSAYLAGALAAKKALAKGVHEFILDIGLHTPSKGSLVFAALKGAVDAGMKTRYSQEIVPSEERVKGAHLSEAGRKGFEEAKQKILG